MQAEGAAGVLIPEESGFRQYRITKDAIGKFISFKCTPVRDDGIVGEPRAFWAPEPARPGKLQMKAEHEIYCDFIFIILFYFLLYCHVL